MHLPRGSIPDCGWRLTPLWKQTVLFAVRDKDNAIRLLAPRYHVDDEKPTQGEIQAERRFAERILRLVSSDARIRFLGFLSSSLASSSGAKPAFVPIFSFGAAEYSAPQ